MMQYKFFATALLILVLTGCSNPDSRYSMVEGTIIYNGAPVEGATVNFQTVSPDGESASGRTDVNGKFTLTSVSAVDGGRGALPGDYQVIVTKREVAPPDPDQAAHDRGEIDYDELQSRMSRRNPYGSGGASPPKHLLPEKYATTATSGLSATVKAGKNDPFNFELVD